MAAKARRAPKGFEGGRSIALRAPSPEGSLAWLGPSFKWFMRCDEREPGSYAPHRHLDYEAIIPVSGSYSCAINGRWIELSPGQGALLKPGDSHEDRFEAGTLYFGVCFSLQEPAPGVFKDGAEPEGQVFSCKTESAMEALAKIQEEGAGRDLLSPSAQDAWLLALLREIIDGLPESALNPELAAGGSQAGSLKTRLTRLFHENLGRDLSVEEMAQMLDLGESSLAHSCKRLLGMPPRKAFLRLKMERAMQLLSGPRVPVKEVAWLLGYKDQFVFSRAFKQVMGSSPLRWRQGALR